MGSNPGYLIKSSLLYQDIFFWYFLEFLNKICLVAAHATVIAAPCAIGHDGGSASTAWAACGGGSGGGGGGGAAAAESAEASTIETGSSSSSSAIVPRYTALAALSLFRWAQACTPPHSGILDTDSKRIEIPRASHHKENSQKIVFWHQNCFDLLCEKIVLVIKKTF